MAYAGQRKDNAEGIWGQNLLNDGSAAVAASSASRTLRAELPKRLRSARANDPYAGTNLNTAQGRRLRDLASSYLRALDNPQDVARQAQVIAAAELQVLAEEARATALREPGTADLEQAVRLHGLADRALRRLGIKATAPKPLTLHTHFMGERA